MYLHGSFVSILGELVTVHIVTHADRTEDIEIGAEGGDVFFDSDPVEIVSSVNDTFDHLLRSQATIRLQTRDLLEDLFCASCFDAVVNIYKGGKCVFAGFVEPQAYSQPYADALDTLEVSCIDALSALQYSPYADIGTHGIGYAEAKANAGQKTFAQAINEIIASLGTLDIVGGRASRAYYDGSKALSSKADPYALPDQISVSELLFLGEDEDGVWKRDKVLEAMLKYLNLHAAMDGLDFRLFAWESVKSDAPIKWQPVGGGEQSATARRTVVISASNAASDDTAVSIGEVYNQISLTCNVETVETVIKSPLDDDDLASPYSNKQKYMTEYSADGEGEQAFNAFYAMTHDQVTDYGGGAVTDWYLQVMDNPMWSFPEPGTGASLIDKYCAGNADQQRLPNLMPTRPLAAIVKLGKVEKKTDHQDNSPVSRLDMTSCLVVSVNGNGKDAEAQAYPTEASLLAASPCAVYASGTSGAVFSPADDKATNYLVVSGKIALNPIMDFTYPYETLRSGDWDALGVWHRTVPSRNNGDGRYYTQRYYKAATPFDAPAYDASTERGLVPFTGTGPEQYEFKYSAIGDGTDTVSKVAALACMLVIGGKCLVETGTDGQVSDFEWRDYKERSQCASDDEYYQQSFAIGFNPKIGDKLIGTEFDIQNNIDYTMGIDAEGIAIPMRKSDRLSGPVRFMILGPVNTLWDDISRRHPTWFRHTKWHSTSIPLMAHVSSIIIRQFEVKVYSDNGLINSAEDSDIVYISDTQERFVNPKDDIEFDISSALTLDECQQLGVSDGVRLSTPLDTTTGTGLLSIYDMHRKAQAKPEQLYVDSYYTEYHKPRIQMAQKLDDRSGIVSLFNLYRHPAMPGKTFYVLGIGRNLREGYAELTLKEIWND